MEPPVQPAPSAAPSAWLPYLPAILGALSDHWGVAVGILCVVAVFGLRIGPAAAPWVDVPGLLGSARIAAVAHAQVGERLGALEQGAAALANNLAPAQLQAAISRLDRSFDRLATILEARLGVPRVESEPPPEGPTSATATPPPSRRPAQSRPQ